VTTRTSDLDRFARHVIHKESLRFWDFNSSSSVPDARVDVSAADALDLAVNSGLVALDEKARGPTPRRDHLHIAQQRLQVEGQSAGVARGTPE